MAEARSRPNNKLITKDQQTRDVEMLIKNSPGTSEDRAGLGIPNSQLLHSSLVGKQSSLLNLRQLTVDPTHI
ncbi:hypothetical protein RRG08_006912 [Elysia crispata]|uniref:Uncharacterized protein n=1 Tax=Elysia crispata TaxID=231223 RepID=A0AAE1BCB7_9GAST|nr:hypothetical protein RRG08_006912 [Elysia crispata]